MNGFLKLLRKQEFEPGLIGLLINPFYFARCGLRKAIGEYAPNLTGRVLDVGCGQKPYRSLFHCDEYVGMDIQQSGHSHESEQIDVFYDGTTFPFPNETFDGVVCTQVLEHVFNPSVFLNELARVLKSQGHLLLTVPFVWDEHEQPYDYARYSSFGLKHLLETHGFEIEAQQKTMRDLRVVVQMANMLIYKGSERLRKTRLGALLATLLLNAPLNIMGSLLWRVFPSNPDLYLDSVVLARKRSPELDLR